MSINKELNDFAREISECVKCGACQAHCPTYRETRREGSVARGKIALAGAVLSGTMELDQGVQRDIEMCLMCGSCVHKCPNKVPTHEIVGALRRQLSRQRGLSPLGKGVGTVLGSRVLMKTLCKGSSLIMPLLLKKIPEVSGLRLRFPLAAMAKRTVPKIPFHNLFDLFPEFIPGRPDRPTIGFFAGCSLTYIYPKVGAAMIRLLNHLGYSIHLPRSQQCCGIPALSSGAGEVVETLAANNTTAFGKYGEKSIVTACASCLGGIGHYYRSMKADYRDFTDKVIDFSVFLCREGVVEELAALPRWESRLRVTYHDPCHLKTQGITAEPRSLLRALPNVELIEMEGADLCCGLGGTFSVSHYKESQAIGAAKLPGIETSGAQKVVTACPGCIIQLQDVINHAGLPVEAVHLLELIEEALK
jgi:glycolate oxidase iron-sulfur subunit